MKLSPAPKETWPYVHAAGAEFLTYITSAVAPWPTSTLGTSRLHRRDRARWLRTSPTLHAWCGAHNLRALQDLHWWEPDGQDSAVRMADMLIKANKAATAARAADRTG